MLRMALAVRSNGNRGGARARDGYGKRRYGGYAADYDDGVNGQAVAAEDGS